mgnify:CR=1 FL=1
MESTSDFLLVHRARAGDEEACERLVRKYYPSIYQYCLLHIYDTYEAEDLTQEVFARAFASLDRYREYGKVKNYLYTIAGNVVKNYYKKKKDIPLEELPEAESENRVDTVGIRLDIEQAVRKLPEELREVAILSFFQELKQREIAGLLQIKLSLVKYRIGRAKELLIKELETEANVNAIVSVTLIFLVSATETIGDTSVLAVSGLGRDATTKETSGSIACDGFVSALSSVFGCLPITSFSQNVGLVAMTKVVNRFTIATGAVIMILAGIFPIFGAVLATLPDAVLGGCTIMMFGTIVVSGIQMLGRCGYTQRNITITALSLSIGLGFTQVPEIFAIFPRIVQTVFAENCVAVVFIVAIILNLVLPKNMEAHTIDTETETTAE